MEKNIRRDDIVGWGADLDPADRPAYPKERTPPRFINPHWSEPDQQIQHIPLLRSTERPRISKVFGTSTPPKGLSGMFRRIAFRYSENDIRHWMILLFADRINVFEGIFEDLSHGHVPNILAEMGIKAGFKYNKKGLAKKALIIGGMAGLLALYLRSKRTEPVY